MRAPRWIEIPVRAVLRRSTVFFPEQERDEVARTAWQTCAAASAQGGFPAFARVTLGELADLLSIRLRQRAGLGPRVTAPGPRPPLWRGTTMALMADFRRAARRLRSNPSALALSVGMLALAIGVSSAMFTVLDALVLHPIPFHDARRLTSVVLATETRYRTASPVAALRAWRDSGAFAGVEGAMQSPVTLEGPEGVFTEGAGRITPGLLAMLGVQPILGRGFVDGEGRGGTSDRMLIAEELWTTHFNRDPSIVGRTVRVSGVPTEIVGVMPAGFRFPYSNTLAWRPIDFSAPPPGLEKATPMVFARLRTDVPAADALRHADEAVRAAMPLPPDQHARFREIATGMVDAYSKRAVMALSAGVALVFLVLCANAMNLMLTRFSVREREFGVCSALGASRARLLREALAETVLVGTVAAGLGLALAVWLVKLATAYLPDALLTRTLTPVAISWRAVVATSILGLLAAAIAGLAPALLATRIDSAEALRSTRTGTDRRAHRRLAGGLLVAEIALAAALLAGAAQLARTFVNLVNADRGLETEGIITGWVSLPRFAFTDRAGRLSFAASLEERLTRMPGVGQVTLSAGIPPQGGSIYLGGLRSDEPGAPEVNIDVNAYDVTPEFFELFGIRLLKGRTFESPSAADEAIVGEQLATILFPNGDAVGRSFVIDGHPAPYRVVGVAREIRSPSFDPRSDAPEMYHPLVVRKDGRSEPSALASGQINVALRCGASCPGIDAITHAIREVSALAEIVNMRPMEEAYMKDLARPRAAAALGGIFATVALLASAGGLFSVLTAAVSRRRREFGIRVALGIAPGRLTALVVRQAFGLAAVGLAFGVFGAWMLSRGLESLTYGVSPADPVTWAAVFGSLALTTILAAWRPGAQAARVDPAELLRAE